MGCPWQKNHYFLQNCCCFEKDGGDCCAKILKPLKKNKEKRTMNCFWKMGSLAKIIDLTTWPHNNHIFQQHLYIRFTKHHDRRPSWSNPFVQRLENWPQISSTLEINITFIMMRLGGDHSLLCSCRMWAYCYAKFKFSCHTYAKMCRQNMPKWQNVFN